MYLKKYGYTILEELDISLLHTVYSEHRRLQVFAKKGCQCVVPGCTRVGTRLIKCTARNGAIHVDLYTDDLHMMTVDHIIPKSKGGPNHISNYQPMCYSHNMAKKNKMPEELVLSHQFPIIKSHEI